MHITRFVFLSYGLGELALHAPALFGLLFKKLQKQVYEEKYVIGKSLQNVEEKSQS
jgi:hypothetical protein